MFGKIAIYLTICLLTLLDSGVMGRARDICNQKPSINSLCVSSTLGIYYDSETQHCKYMGCSSSKLFATLEDCEKICNNNRHQRRRLERKNFD